MDRNEFIKICDSRLKLVRTEFSLSQEKMAIMLGISKKTLVEIEKGRSSLGWSGGVVLCSVFSESQVIQGSLGANPADIIKTIAFEQTKINSHRANSVSIWWQTVEQRGEYLIEQNIVSQHYRLLKGDGEIIASSFDIEELRELMR